jgi:DNA-binding beta-propeller fold protein YncE
MHAEPERLKPAVWALVVVGAIGVAACGTDEHPGNEPEVATTVATTPEETVPEALWSRGRVKIAFPDGLAALQGAVFVKTDDGHVVRVDRASHRIERRAEVDTTSDPNHYCEGIGTDGRTLWACSAAEDGRTDLVRLDPSTLEVLGTVRIDKIFDQLAVPVVDGRAWVLTGAGDTLTALDTSTTHTTSYPLGRACLQAAATSTTVYVTCQLTDKVLAVDANTGAITHEAGVADPTNVAADDDDVWVSGSDGLVHLTPDLQPRTVYPGLVAGRDGDLLLTRGAAWVRQGPGFLFRIDTGTGRVTAHYEIDPVPSGGSLLAVGDEIWTSSSDDDFVAIVDAAH